jgi:methionyl-tRNA synthetase
VFRDLFARAQISNDHFIRTTDSNHKEAVSEFWNALSHRITEGSHAGFYSTNEETFVMEKDLIREGNVYKT